MERKVLSLVIDIVWDVLRGNLGGDVFYMNWIVGFKLSRDGRVGYRVRRYIFRSRSWSYDIGWECWGKEYK